MNVLQIMKDIFKTNICSTKISYDFGKKYITEEMETKLAI